MSKNNEQSNNQPALLKVSNLSVKLKSNGLVILNNVNFEILKNEKVALFGPSGEGKSTLFKAILKLLPEAIWEVTGSVILNGIDIYKANLNTLQTIRGSFIRVLLQEPSLSINPSLKIKNQLFEAIKTVQGITDTEELTKISLEALSSSGIKIPRQVLESYTSQLSGGQRQRAGMALSLCCQARILLADEPSSSLDSITVCSLIDTLIEKLKTGYIESIFLISHDPHLVKALDCDKILLLKKGQLSLLDNIDAYSVTQSINKIIKTQKQKSFFKVKSNQEDLEDEFVKNAKTAFTIKNLKVGYKQKSFLSKKHNTIIDGLDLNIKKGLITGIVGSSGSGKTTLAMSIAGLKSTLDGEITYKGSLEDIKTNSKNKKQQGLLKKRIQMVFQNLSDTFDPSLTIKSNLIECYRAMGLSYQKIDTLITPLLKALNLSYEQLYKYPHALSGGQRQRFGLMRTMGVKAEVIIADEPFVHLDTASQKSFLNYLLDRRKDPNDDFTCLIISHNIGLIAKVCDDIIVVNNGEIAEQNNANSILKNPVASITTDLIQAAEKLSLI